MAIMYITKGTEDVTLHYIEIPALLSLKLSAFRFNVGPYIGICLDNISSGYYIRDNVDFGFSTGLGFDMGMFYIGILYDIGLVDMSNIRNFEFYNRTLGFNFGVNL